MKRVKSAWSVVLAISLSAAGTPAAAQVQDQISSSRSHAPIGGPLDRAIRREAVRLAAEDSTPDPGGTRQGGTSKDSDWFRLRDLGGEEIILSIHGSPVGHRYVVRNTVDANGVTVLNLTSPALPAAVTSALADAAWSNAYAFGNAQHGVSARLDDRVTLAAGGVWLNGQRVADLNQLVERVDRYSVTEIRLVHSAVKRGMAWGTLIGAALGLGIVFASCGTNWNQETSSCSNLTGMWLFVGPALGFAWGAIFGAASKISTVEYRAP